MKCVEEKWKMIVVILASKLCKCTHIPDVDTETILTDLNYTPIQILDELNRVLAAIYWYNFTQINRYYTFVLHIPRNQYFNIK